MSARSRVGFCIAVALALAWSATGMAQAAALPKNFRTWAHTKSLVIPDKKHGLYGFHNIYANNLALPLVKKPGGKYPEGAQFVVSFYDVVNANGMTSQGAKLMDAVMTKSAKATATGGWEYAVFDAAGKPKAINAAKDCHACHINGAKKTDFVFHKYIP